MEPRGIADVMDSPLPVHTQALPVLQPSYSEVANFYPGSLQGQIQEQSTVMTDYTHCHPQTTIINAPDQTFFQNPPLPEVASNPIFPQNPSDVHNRQCAWFIERVLLQKANKA